MMTAPQTLVYLAGPVTGLTQDAARFGWRKVFAEAMPGHVAVLSPLRCDPRVRGTMGRKSARHVQRTDAAITTRDLSDIARADVMVAVLDGDSVSAGTCIEIGYAAALRKPIVSVIPSGGPHDHPMVRHLCAFHCRDVAQAAEVVAGLLTPGL